MITILQGDVIEQLRTLPDESVHCCVTSPPYWGLRDYSTNGQIGLEKTPEEYVAKMVEVFREVRRVLRKDGTLWLNLGDSYAGGGNGAANYPGDYPKQNSNAGTLTLKGRSGVVPTGLKPKDLCGIPWRVAFALQADGWWLRSDIIWAKPNPMPESVTDRPTKAHEYLFLLTKSANYFYDAEAIKEQSDNPYTLDCIAKANGNRGRPETNPFSKQERFEKGQKGLTRGELGALMARGRNKRSVWTVATAPYPEAHFATYPPDLIKPCILAGTSAKGCCVKCGSPWERVTETKSFEGKTTNANPELERGPTERKRADGTSCSQFAKNRFGDCESKTIGWQPTCKCLASEWGTHPFNAPIPCTVLDPFAGSGTTGAVALELGRKAILIELNPKYVELIKHRCNITPGLQLAI